MPARASDSVFAVQPLDNPMQAITVSYMPATNHKPSRLKARAGAGQVIIPYPDNAKSYDSAYDSAAIALIDKMGWREHGTWTRGHTHDGTAVYVCGSHDWETLTIPKV